MSKFILTSFQDENVTTKEFESEYLFDVVERFEEFLRGCGYFFEGTLEIVNDEATKEISIVQDNDSFDYTTSFMKDNNRAN